MVTFSVALALLIIGYMVYGGFVNRIFGPDPKRETPAVAMNDGVDYIPMPTWKIFMIQFLNIAGLGPIFGAIMGAQFGTASYLWIVIGTLSLVLCTTSSRVASLSATMEPTYPN